MTPAVQLDFIAQAEQRQRAAADRLARIVEQRRDSFELRDFNRRRAAALRHTRGVAG